LIVKPAWKAIRTPIGFPTGRALLPILVVNTRNMINGRIFFPSTPYPCKTFSIITVINSIDVTSSTSAAIMVASINNTNIRREGFFAKGFIRMEMSQSKNFFSSRRRTYMTNLMFVPLPIILILFLLSAPAG